MSTDVLLVALAADSNVARRLSAMAAVMPDAPAILVQRSLGEYRRITFRELDADSTLLAAGLAGLGVQRGMRIALLVRPGIAFITLVFALFKAGAVIVLIDPGLGRGNLVNCLADAEPRGFVAIPLVHAVRRLMRRRFAKATLNVVVGRSWFGGGVTLERLREIASANFVPLVANADDPAAIIFTTGSTGPPKGVLYRHGNFDEQVTQLRDRFGIRPGEIDLAGFPLFGLFNAALGVTTVVPDMNPARPAEVGPRKFVAAIQQCRVTQAFGSPAIFNRVGAYCERQRIQLPSLQRVLSAGAPVPAHVLRRMKAALEPAAEMHTPYGATEALPVASIAASEVLAETADKTANGAGVCVGRRFAGIHWKVVRIVDGPIAALSDVVELPAGEIGELIVSGPVVTTEYVTRTEANALAKIRDGASFWHRMGDSGYLDAQERFWFCGRVAHRVITASGTLYTIRCEAIFNAHPDVFRSALVGVGPPGKARPVVVVETWPERRPRGWAARDRLVAQLRQRAAANPLTAEIKDFLLHPSLPVDIRHNAKIFRERLAVWAAEQLK